MKFTLSALLTLFSTYSFADSQIEFSAFIQEGCLKPVESLAREYLKEHEDEVNQKLSRRSFMPFKIDLGSISVCGVHSLEPGSFDVLRETRICGLAFASKDSKQLLSSDPRVILFAEVVLLTRGDLYCTNEEVIELQSVKLSGKPVQNF